MEVMKITPSIQASTTNTLITVNSEDSITIDGVTEDLSAIPNEGQADASGNILGTITKDASGECTLTVLVKYNPRDTDWNGEELKQLNPISFPVDLTISDFIQDEVQP